VLPTGYVSVAWRSLEEPISACSGGDGLALFAGGRLTGSLYSLFESTTFVRLFANCICGPNSSIPRRAGKVLAGPLTSLCGRLPAFHFVHGQFSEIQTGH
jgi:hypothetical protein